MLVSVCIPAYNHARFLRAALESALAQSHTDIEVIVSDNKSTDDTPDVVSEFVRKDPRIRYERAAVHVGMAENFNRCLSLARGKYVKFLCADDMLEPQCVERLVWAIESRNAVLAGCARYLVDASAAATLKVARFSGSDWEGPGEAAARRCFFFGNLIGEPTAALFRRDAPERFAERYSQLMDLDLWLRILERGRFGFVAEPLCRIRLHPSQATRGSAATGRITGDKRQLFRDFAHRPYMRGTLMERLLWDFRMEWSAQREPPGLAPAALADGLFFPGLRNVMVAGAAAARLLRIGGKR